MERFIRRGLGGPQAQNFCPCEVGRHHPSCTWMCSPTGSPPNPRVWGFFMKALSRRHDQALTLFPASLPSLEDGGWG